MQCLTLALVLQSALLGQSNDAPFPAHRVIGNVHYGGSKALATYLIVLAGTLFGLTIVVLRGALGVDLWIHVAMLTGLLVGLALILRERGRAVRA